MDPVTGAIVTAAISAGIEGLKFLATSYVESKKLQGKTDAEILAEFNSEYATFKASDPNAIPDPKK